MIASAFGNPVDGKCNDRAVENFIEQFWKIFVFFSL
jgi:hypothetical protein